MGCHSTSAKYTAGNLESAQLPIPAEPSWFQCYETFFLPGLVVSGKPFQPKQMFASVFTPFSCSPPR